MRKVRRAAAMAVLLSLFVGLFPLAVSLPTATSASVVAQQQQDLDYLMETLEASHPDLYAHTEKAVFTRKADSIRQNLANMTDFDFAIELQSLVALAGDSHTMLSVGGLADQATFLPLSIQWMEGKWLLSVLPEGMEDRLGQQLVSVNGRSVEEIYEAVRPFYSYDNEIKLRRQFRQNFYLVPLLQHYGILGRDAQNATPGVPRRIRPADGFSAACGGWGCPGAALPLFPEPAAQPSAGHRAGPRRALQSAAAG